MAVAILGDSSTTGGADGTGGGVENAGVGGEFTVIPGLGWSRRHDSLASSAAFDFFADDELGRLPSPFCVGRSSG